MIDMVRRHEIQVLRRAGHSLVETAKQVGVSQSSVQRVEAEPPIVSFDKEAEVAKRGVGRPSKAEPFRSFLVGELAKQPDVMALELLRRARNEGYSGAKTALYELVKELRPEKVRPIVRFEGVAGEFSQHDFGHVDVHFIDGRKQRVHFFASRLKYSRWVEVKLVPNEQVETLVRAMVEHFAEWGGMPLLAVFDRPKTIATSWNKDSTVIEWNPTFGNVILDLGLAVELCWPRSPEQKGSVENLVGWVKGSFFKQRLRRRRGRPASAPRVARGGQHEATVACDARRTRAASRRGTSSATSAAHRASRSRAAHSGARRPDGLRRP
jgi:transposase